MVLKRIEDFEAYKQVQKLWVAVSAILKRPALCKDRDLWKHISDANDSMPSNLSEGFEQPTDRAFAKYVYISKGSAAEIRTRLGLACDKGYITADELRDAVDLADGVCRLCAGLIGHLLRSNRKDRGISRARIKKEKQSTPAQLSESTDTKERTAEESVRTKQRRAHRRNAPATSD